MTVRNKNTQNYRAPWHDYRSRSFYMITLTMRPGTPRLANLVDSPAPHAESTAFGDALDSAMSEVFNQVGQIKILERCLMPDHAHYVIYVMMPISKPLGSFVGRAKGAATAAMRRLTGLVDADYFEPDFNDRIVYSRGRLQTLIDYVRDNPRRAIVKRLNPQLFVVRHSVDIGGKLFDACGNIFLLDEPELMPVVIHRRWSEEELARAKESWRRGVRNGAVLISPFISPREKEVLWDAMDAGGRAIVITNVEMGERYKPSGLYFDLCASGRLLLLSAEEVGRSDKISRADALAMNGLARAIALRGNVDK